MIGAYSYAADTEVKRPVRRQPPATGAAQPGLAMGRLHLARGYAERFQRGCRRRRGSTYGDQANTYDGYAGSYTLYDAAVRWAN